MTQLAHGRDSHAEGLRVAADIALAQGTSDIVPLTLTELCSAAGASTASFYAEFASVAEFRREVVSRLIIDRLNQAWQTGDQQWDSLDLSKWPDVVYAVADELAKKSTAAFLGSWAWMTDPVMQQAVLDLYSGYTRIAADAAALGRDYFGVSFRVRDDVVAGLLRPPRDAAVIAKSVIADVAWSDNDNVERTSSVFAILLRGMAETLSCDPMVEPSAQPTPADAPADSVAHDTHSAPETASQSSSYHELDKAAHERRERFFRTVLGHDFPEPFSNLTFAQVATKAGMSASTLAHHFEDSTDFHQQVFAEVAFRLDTAATDEGLSKLEHVLFASRGQTNRAQQIVAVFAEGATRRLARDSSFGYFVACAGSTDIPVIHRTLHQLVDRLRLSWGKGLRLVLSGTDLDLAAVDPDVVDDVVVVAIIAGALHRHLGHERDKLDVQVDGVTLELGGAALTGALRLLVDSATPVTRQGEPVAPEVGQCPGSTYDQGMAAAATIVYQHGPAELTPMSVAEVCRAAKTGASSFYRVFGTAENFRTDITTEVLNAKLENFERDRGWSNRAVVAVQSSSPDSLHDLVESHRSGLRRATYLRTWSWIGRSEVADVLRTHLQVRATKKGAVLALIFSSRGQDITVSPTSFCLLLRHLTDTDVLLDGPSPSVTWHDKNERPFTTSIHHLVSWGLVDAFVHERVGHHG